MELRNHPNDTLPNMNAAQIHLGTSSWMADGWVGSFYPPGTRQADFLTHYARRYDTVEIDSTFYRIPAAKTVQQWRERTPDGFTFAAKVPQSITHEKMLVDVEDDLKAFLKVMDLMGDKLGPLLFQFPYFNRQKFRGVGFFLERLEPFLRRLPKGYQWAVEVRTRTGFQESCTQSFGNTTWHSRLWIMCGCHGRTNCSRRATR